LNSAGSQLEFRVATWIAGQSTEDFGDILLAAHAYQRAANPAYDRYCESFSPATDWQQIPALPQQVFKQTAVRCFAESETATTFRTSGTTGEGYGQHHFESLTLYRLAATRGWIDAGLADVGEVISLIPPIDEAPHSSLSCMADWVADTHLGPDWPAVESASRQRTAPVVLFGSALAFLDWCEHLGVRQLTLPPGSLAVETGGYKGTHRRIEKPDLYARFADHLGLPADAVVNEYGMTELSSQFYTRGLGQPHRHPPWARGLVIDPESNTEVPEGATGVLRLFDAANLGSCVAIQTRDLAIRRGEQFELLGRDPAALPRGCSRAADEMLSRQD
jgi:hypothetical protein